jgi:hypothetical protein
MCYIADGQTGACDRYANNGGRIVRTDPVVMLSQAVAAGHRLVPFALREWTGDPIPQDAFVTGIGSGTTYPDYKPAPFIVSSTVAGADMVTVVTEAIFSYCGVKVKIDTDRHLGAEGAVVRAQGEAIGHVTTAEYGSQMLSIGGVHHLTGGSKAEGRATCAAMLALCNGEAVELTIDGGSGVVVQAGRAPVVDGVVERRMRVGCGSATIGMFAAQWQGLVDEVVVVDDHITGVVSEHQAGKVLGWQPSGIRILGHRSTPGQGAVDGQPPARSLPIRAGRHFDPAAPFTQLRAAVDCGIANHLHWAGGSLRAGVTKNPVRLTRSVQSRETVLTSGGAECYIWPGGGITFMVDVTRLPAGAFGYVPTPALVAPLEFTLPRDAYLAMGGHEGAITSVDRIVAEGGEYPTGARVQGWPE